MQLVKLRLPSGRESVGLLEDDSILPLALEGGQYRTLTELLHADDPTTATGFFLDRLAKRIPLADAVLLPPIDRQEVWAAGVTYRRSRTARMEESQGAATFYDKVYDAPRPELFFKATAQRVVGPGVPVRIRQDSLWTVPEPELALVLNARLELVGFTIGNDMSARDIEGENPLYLSQAKIYSGCCALGPCVTLAIGMPALEKIGIQLRVQRGGQIAFEGSTSAGKISRTFEDLIEYLGRDNDFPDGVILLTGTGIVPDDSFALRNGDVVEITIDGIGTLVNPVVQA